MPWEDARSHNYVHYQATLHVVNPRRMREGYGTCSVIRSFVHYVAFVLSTELQRPSLTSEGKGMNRLSTTMACNLTRGAFAKVLSFSSYGWLTLTTVFDLSDDKSAHSWLPKYL